MNRRLAPQARKAVSLRTKLRSILLLTIGLAAMFLVVFALALPALIKAAYPTPDRLTGVYWAALYSPALQLVGISGAAISVLLGISTGGRVIVMDWLNRRPRA